MMKPVGKKRPLGDNLESFPTKRSNTSSTDAKHRPVSLGSLDRLSCDVMHHQILPLLASDGSLLRFSQCSRASRNLTLSYAFAKTTAQQDVLTKTMQRALPVTALGELESHLLLQCQDFLNEVRQVRRPLAYRDLLSWQNVEISSGIGSLEGKARVHDATRAIMMAVDTRSTSLRVRNMALRSLPDAFSGLSWLESADFSGNKLGVIQGLAPLTSLRELDLSNNSLGDVEELAHLPSLQTLCLAENRPLEEVAPLGNLRNLRHLDISGTCVHSLEFLRSHPALESLSTVDSMVDVYEALLSIPTLTYFNVMVDADLPLALRSKPDLEIDEE